MYSTCTCHVNAYLLARNTHALTHDSTEVLERLPTSRAREALVDVLEAIGCEKCAEFLMLGAIDMLWK